MDTIISHKKQNGNRYSKLSLIISLITLGLFVYLFLSIPKTMKVSDDLFGPSLLLVIATHIFCLAGMVMMILSFNAKESSNWVKWVGAILNVLLFLTIEGSAIFVMIFKYIN